MPCPPDFAVDCDHETKSALIAGVVIGLTGAYYAVFSGLILAGIAVVAFLADRDRVRAVSTVLVAEVVGVTLLFSLTPTLAYRVANGTNPEAGVRSYSDVERCALKPVHMLLPIPFHRIELLREPMGQAVTGVPTPRPVRISVWWERRDSSR